MIFHIDNSIMGQGKDIVLNFAKALQTAADNQHCVELTPRHGTGPKKRFC